MHLGAEMYGGEIVVEGDASDSVGAQMYGGRIRVKEVSAIWSAPRTAAGERA